MKRSWEAARAKVDREGCCRVCSGGLPQAAHVIGRDHDRHDDDGVVRVNPADIVPLCARHHTAYDARQLDLLPHLTKDEQAQAVLHVGIIRAYHRITSSQGSLDDLL